MKKLAIVGAGISGLSAAQLLKSKYNVTIFEKDRRPGGLIKCERINDNLYHRVGGHVFNSKNPKVLDWFWKFFDREKEFISIRRNAKILINNKLIGYPIENYIYQLDNSLAKQVISEIVEISAQRVKADIDLRDSVSFKDFLLQNFGATLYTLYFEPYNQKIWLRDLSDVPLEWLEGKLPMPDPRQIIVSNILRQEESNMVHSSFYYPRENGSQFIADRLSQDLDIRYRTPVTIIQDKEGLPVVNGESFFHVIYTGDIRDLKDVVSDDKTLPKSLLKKVSDLSSNGTTNIFCECDPTEMSWLYIADKNIPAHRIIYTGSFAQSNNRGSSRMTCVVEFSGHHEQSFAEYQVKFLPGNMIPLSYHYQHSSYVVQSQDTRRIVNKLRDHLDSRGITLLGRFAEWEYYNMDKAIESAMTLSQRF